MIKDKLRFLFSLLLCTILLMSSQMAVFAESNEPADQIKSGDILCFGTPDDSCGFDGKWLVLDSENTNTGESGIFVTSLNLIGTESGDELIYRQIGDVSVSFLDRGKAFARENPGSQAYQGSEIQQWCNEFCESHFSETEKSAILPTYKSDDAATIPGFGIPLPGAANGTVDFDPVENILNGDQIFLLSAEEAYNESYGFTDNQSRVALYKGSAAGYWLRSPHIDTFPLDVGFVFSFGALMDYPVNGQFMFHMDSFARPAMNIDADKITVLEALSTENGVTIWKVSFQGEESNLNEYDTSLPVVGDVIDLTGIVQKAFFAAVFILITAVVLIVFLIVRYKRKKKIRKDN